MKGLLHTYDYAIDVWLLGPSNISLAPNITRPNCRRGAHPHRHPVRWRSRTKVRLSPEDRERTRVRRAKQADDQAGFEDEETESAGRQMRNLHRAAFQRNTRCSTG